MFWGNSPLLMTDMVSNFCGRHAGQHFRLPPNDFSSAHVIGPIYLPGHLLSQPAVESPASTSTANTFHFRSTVPFTCDDTAHVQEQGQLGYDRSADCHFSGSHFSGVYKPRVTQEQTSSPRLASQANTSVSAPKSSVPVYKKVKMVKWLLVSNYTKRITTEEQKAQKRILRLKVQVQRRMRECWVS